MQRLEIRPARPADAGAILGFIRDLAQYEHAADAVEANEDTIRETIFGNGATVHALIAERGGAPIGFAVYFFNYSTWQGRNGIYLEDLYVAPEHRGTGAGKALLRRLAQIALEKNCGRFEWSVLDWNEPSIRVYESIGAKPQSDWVRYRLEGESLRNFAAS
ncbi:MAG TPA: GNAT family N-acetyltransferase [Pararhizobium sp.]|nr:GNAT family N-acetyltransferase [Pararhizobium sp.]